ncbi:hypothetical protein OJAV_G00111920 [Oryzias javanicus]|uniref:Uncharacterized protein n=1 Tax=Oryzias javanicus TaxID=123683 RepID=A0A437CVF3_ORYJA|nr:hypothetical protein OJAV_G00111920 [Oryzias javanicus]
MLGGVEIYLTLAAQPSPSFPSSAFAPRRFAQPCTHLCGVRAQTVVTAGPRGGQKNAKSFRRVISCLSCFNIYRHKNRQQR